MSTPVVYNGVTYNVPAFGDTGYAQGAGNLSSYFIALATGSLNRSGGSFILTNDVNFGSNFGLLADYFTSITVNPATAGRVRLAKTDTIDWRNNANSANLALGIDGTDHLTFNGATVQVGPDNGITQLTGDGTATGPGSVPFTLATVNGNVGSFANANITVNGKGLITSASNGTVGGVTAVHSDSNPDITGNVHLVSGTNVTLSQSGQDITINSSGGGSGITQLTGEVTAGPGSGSQAATLTNSAVIAKVLTGFTSGSGTVSASDSILTAIEKVNANQQLDIPLTGGFSGTTGTINGDATTGGTLSVTLTGNITINSILNGTDGQKLILRIINDSTGRTVAFQSLASNSFRFGTGITSFTSSGANKTDYVGVIFRSSASRWDIVSVSQGFAN